uniref:F-box associated domain-containing protein n=1 Tax=Leersia perrieri TaxID=77586 RepID=A0A0D9XUG2_9ORYZ
MSIAAAAARFTRLITTARRHGGSPRGNCSGAAALLPVRGIFMNYIDHGPTHLLTHPSMAAPAKPTINDGFLSFLPGANPNHDSWDTWSVLDHCNGLLLCHYNESRLCVCNPATRRWEKLPKRLADDGSFTHRASAYLAFDPAVSPSSRYEVFVIPNVPVLEMKMMRSGT